MTDRIKHHRAALTESGFRRPESILLVVYTASGDTLLLKRRPPRSFWQSVTGAMRWTEDSPIETAIRELAEETGIVASENDIRNWNRNFRFPVLREIRHRYDGDGMNLEHVFSFLLPNIVPTTILESEHSDYRWEPLENALDSVWSWSNREAIWMVNESTSNGSRRQTLPIQPDFPTLKVLK